MIRLPILIVLLSSVPVWGSSAQSRKAFCDLGREDFLIQFSDPGQRLSFANPIGSLGIGNCWWHSLFQRSSIYLTVFRPDLPRPGHKEAIRIIRKIIGNKGVVEIPGFSTLFEFSQAFDPEMESELARWQIIDGFIRQKWIVDLFGNKTTSAEDLWKKMNRIYRYSTLNRFVPYTKIKLNRVVAHALLVVDIRPAREGEGFELEVIDSNFPARTISISYRKGDRSLALLEDDMPELVPYLERTPDLGRIEKAFRKYCDPVGGSRFLKK